MAGGYQNMYEKREKPFSIDFYVADRSVQNYRIRSIEYKQLYVYKTRCIYVP